MGRRRRGRRQEAGAGLAKQIPMGSNMRASAAYRSHLAEVLLKGLRRWERRKAGRMKVNIMLNGKIREEETAVISY